MKKMNWFVGAVAAVAVASPAFGQIGIYIGAPPPPIQYEAPPPMPGPGYVWQDGYWGNDGGRYLWRPGRWNQPPYPNAYWNHPHYDHYQQGWQMHEGHWDREDHGDRGDHGNHGEDRGRH